MTKIIVTHYNPDLDAIGAVWLLQKYLPELREADIYFVPAGNTYQNQSVDSNPNIIHVDTGLGKFDHHQLTAKTCATSLVFNYLKSKKITFKDEKALIRLIKVICEIDHFADCLWPKAEADYFNFNLQEILRGLKSSNKLDDLGLVSFGQRCLDSIYNNLHIKIKAEKDLENGFVFKTRWGKAIGCLSSNDQVLKLGQKLGYIIVVQKDSLTEHVRIKARPDSRVDLTSIKEKLSKLDSQATWFLHISKKLLLNGSSKNDKMKPSQLSLAKVIEVLKE